MSNRAEELIRSKLRIHPRRVSLSITHKSGACYLHRPHTHVHTYTLAAHVQGLADREMENLIVMDSAYCADNKMVRDIPILPLHLFRSASTSARAVIISNLISMLRRRFEYEWEPWRAGTLSVCLLIELFPLGWITHSMVTRCSRAKNDAPQTPMYSDSFKWILESPPPAPIGRDTACYVSRLFDILLIRKYHLCLRFVCWTRRVMYCMCTGCEYTAWICG